MNWWGKIFGSTLGYVIGGPIGGLLGMALGHNVDRTLRNNRVHGLTAQFVTGNDVIPTANMESLAAGGGIFDETDTYDQVQVEVPDRSRTRIAKVDSKPVQARAQTAFFTATFSVMGHVAAIDGEINDDEYRIMKALMERMSLTDEQKDVAERIFGQGRLPDFPLVPVIKQLKRECRNNSNLLRVFLEGQLHGAYADGELNRHEKDALLDISKRLGFNRREFGRIDNMVRAQHNLNVAGESVARSGGTQRKTMSVDEAYAILGLSSHIADADIQKAYRRLLSQHHPDKLVAKGLPEEMVRLASEKTTEIRSAYEVLREYRNF